MLVCLRTIASYRHISSFPATIPNDMHKNAQVRPGTDSKYTRH